MRATLAIDLTIPAGREAEAAKRLAQVLPAAEWGILAAFAAEIVHEHENRTGATVVVVAGAPAADRVLQDLRRAK